MPPKKKVEDLAQAKPRAYEDTFSLSQSDLDALSIQIRRDLLQGEEEKDAWTQERAKDVEAYFGIKKRTDWPFKGAAKVSSQMHRVMVNTMAANLKSSIDAPANILSALTKKSQSIENAKYVEDLHNGLARFEYHFPDVFDRAIHNALIESFVVLVPRYEMDVTETVATVTRWLPKEYNESDITYDLATDTVLTKDGQVIPSLDINRLPEDPEELKRLDLHECILEVTKEHLKEGVKIYSVPGTDVFISIGAPGETPHEKYQRAPFVIEQEYKTIEEMKILQEQKKIKNFDILASSLSDSLSAETLRDLKEEQTGFFDIDTEKRRLVRNLWWYGKFNYKGKLRELIVYMNYETGTILKVMVNKLGIRPFFPIVPFPVDQTPFGESLPKQIRYLVSELELVMNTIINMGMIKAYPPKFYDPNSGFDPKTLGPIGPNAYIPVRDPGRNVFMPPQPEDPRILMEMVKLMMDLIERATGNSDAVQGQTSPTANTTAFEVQQALVRAGVRFDTIYKRIKEQLSPMFSYIHKLLLLHMPIEKEFELMGRSAVIQGQDGSTMSRLQAINQQEGEFGLALTGLSLAEEQQNQMKAEKLFMMMQQDPYISYKPTSAYQLRFPLVKYLNPTGMDQILPTPEEVAQLLRDRHTVNAEQEQKALDENKGSNAEAQAAQMELQLKAAQAQMDAQMKQQEMALKEKEHEQKLRQLEETHRLKLELMREQQNAKNKEKKSNGN